MTVTLKYSGATKEYDLHVLIRNDEERAKFKKLLAYIQKLENNATSKNKKKKGEMPNE